LEVVTVLPDHRRVAVLPDLARRPLADEDLLKHEVDLLGRLGQPHRVVRSDLEDSAEEAVR
jgi:hypothetical protein